MHPRIFAQSHPGKKALVFEPSGRSRTYSELEETANKGARLFRQLGISKGDKVAFCLENCPEVFDFCWAAQRAGLFYVPVSSRFTADEIAYILRDSGARLLLTSDYLAKELDSVANACLDIHLFKTGKDHEAYVNCSDWRRERRRCHVLLLWDDWASKGDCTDSVGRWASGGR